MKKFTKNIGLATLIACLGSSSLCLYGWGISRNMDADMVYDSEAQEKLEELEKAIELNKILQKVKLTKVSQKAQDLMNQRVDIDDTELVKVFSECVLDEQLAGILENLLKYGLRVDGCYINSITPLYSAISANCLSNIKLLLIYGANVNAIIDTYKNTYLMHAVSRGLSKVVKELLLNNADPNMQNSLGETALMKAVQLRNCFNYDCASRKDLVLILIGFGADHKKKDNNGKSAIDIAYENKFEDIAQLIESVELIFLNQFRSSCPTNNFSYEQQCLPAQNS